MESCGKERERETDRLIRDNLRLVLKIANSFLGRGLPWEDLVSEGNRGLVTAAKRYDPGRGAKFSTYSVWWIKQAIRQALAEQTHLVRVPVGTQQRWRKIHRIERELSLQWKRPPDDAELAEACRLPLPTIRRLRRARKIDVQSLHAACDANDPEGAEILDLIADETAVAPDEQHIRIEDVDELLKLLATLSVREQRVLQLRFGLNGEAVRTLEEVGAAIGCTNERARQIQLIALKKLQNKMKKRK